MHHNSVIRCGKSCISTTHCGKSCSTSERPGAMPEPRRGALTDLLRLLERWPPDALAAMCCILLVPAPTDLERERSEDGDALRFGFFPAEGAWREAKFVPLRIAAPPP
mmetsp:Transcript_39172/g.73434  ORF Transcript_39172/g.73434 Transcript_39172/m.73434 type:complete len:108 (-) Transcript_39172:4744-5067(-)